MKWLTLILALSAMAEFSLRAEEKPLGRGLPAPTKYVGPNFGYYPTCWRPFPEDCLRNCPPSPVISTSPAATPTPAAQGTVIEIPSMPAKEKSAEGLNLPKDGISSPIPRLLAPETETPRVREQPLKMRAVEMPKLPLRPAASLGSPNLK